jgi:hypothetical protein
LLLTAKHHKWAIKFGRNSNIVRFDSISWE